MVRTAEELTATNAVTGWLESFGAVASSLATGVLLAVAGPGSVFAAAGLSGLVSVGLAASVPKVRPPTGDAGQAASPNCSPGFGSSPGSRFPGCSPPW